MPRLPAPELKVEGKLEVDPCEFKLLVLRLNDDLDAQFKFLKTSMLWIFATAERRLSRTSFTRSVARNLQSLTNQTRTPRECIRV
jgi:hypothetical protein